MRAKLQRHRAAYALTFFALTLMVTFDIGTAVIAWVLFYWAVGKPAKEVTL